MSLTTDDLKQIKTVVEEVVDKVVDKRITQAVAPLATKAELAKLAAKMATKDDLDRMETRITTSMGLLERDTFSRLDQHEARITRLEQARQ